MASLVHRVIHEFLECFTEPVERGEPDAYYTLCSTFDTLLYLFARGNIAFGQESGMTFCKPADAPPTPKMQRDILARLRADRPIHFLILEALTDLIVSDPGQPRPRPVASAPTAPEPRTIHYPSEGFALDVDRDCLRIRSTDYHSTTLVLLWQEVFDMARGMGLGGSGGAPP